jgi:hypothetical protein
LSDDREQRLARNEAFFRETNEMLAKEGGTNTGGRADFICECSRSGCVDRLTITVGEYEAVRETSERFVVVTGHEDPSLEVVVERKPGYTVVEKIGAAAVIARETDPR